MKTPTQTANRKSTTTSFYDLFYQQYEQKNASGKLAEETVMTKVMGQLTRHKVIFNNRGNAMWLIDSFR